MAPHLHQTFLYFDQHPERVSGKKMKSLTLVLFKNCITQ